MWEWIGISVAVALVIAFIVYMFIRKNTKCGHISVENIIGDRCKVVETIDNYAGCGLVKVKGQVWSARGVDEDDIFEVGETLLVVAIEGVKLICKKFR